MLSTDKFCKICGYFLLNVCAGEAEGCNNNRVIYSKQPCGTIADNNARYCTQCGCETVYKQRRLLKDWYKEQKAKTDNEEIPF